MQAVKPWKTRFLKEEEDDDVVVVIRACMSDLGGTTGVMDQERGDCRRLESFGSCRIAGFFPAATNNRPRSEKARAHLHRPSVCMYKGFPNRGTGHGPVNRARTYAHTYTPGYDRHHYADYKACTHTHRP